MNCNKNLLADGMSKSISNDKGDNEFTPSHFLSAW